MQNILKKIVNIFKFYRRTVQCTCLCLQSNFSENIVVRNECVSVHDHDCVRLFTVH